MSLKDVCSTSELEPGQARAFEVAADGGKVEIAIVRTWDGDWFAIQDECSHGAVSLADGEVEDCSIECWLHGSRFDLSTGTPLALPATEPIATYPITIDGDRVLVAVGTDLDTPTA